MRRLIKQFHVCSVLLVMVWVPHGFPAQADDRGDLIEKELDCVSRSLGAGQEVVWSDICYTWDEPRTDARSQLIDATLDAYEQVRTVSAPSSRKAEPLGYTEYSESPFTGSEEGREPIEPDNNPEGWLRSEYPYFYKEHMIKKRTDRDYYPEDDKKKESHLEAPESANDPSILPFLELIDYGFTVETHQKPSYFVEAVFPLFESDGNTHTIFNQNRVSVVSTEDKNYSSGLGYRYFDAGFPFIVGGNIFYDLQGGGNHYRLGYGAEFFTEFAEARFNYYNALSSRRTLHEIPFSGNPPLLQFEQAVDGFDMELGSGIPMLSIAKVFGGYESYDHKHSEDITAWTGRLEIKPASSMTLNLEYINENDKDPRYRFDGRLSFPFSTFDPKDIFAEIKGANLQPQPSDLVKRLRDRVERSNTIAVERWVERGEENIVPLPVGSGGDIQIQLIWETDSDIDLHINLPAGSPTHVYWAQPQSFIGPDLFAELDVDDIPLSGGHVDHPGRDHVENIFVVEGMAVAGTYSPFVEAFNNVAPTPVTVNVFVDGQYVSTSTHTFTFTGEQFNLPDIVYP